MSHELLSITVNHEQISSRFSCRRTGKLLAESIRPETFTRILRVADSLLETLDTQGQRDGTPLDLRDLKDGGEQLGQLLLGEDLLRHLRQHSRESLLITLPSALRHVPVELIWTGAGFLARQTAVGIGFPGATADRTSETESIAHSLAPGERLRARLLADSTFELLHAQYEATDMMDLWRKHRDRLEVADDWNQKQTSWLTLQDALHCLSEADWLHLCGHARPTDKSPQRGWVFRDGLLTVNALVEAGLNRVPQFVFAHACAAASIPADDPTQASLVEELSRRGCRHFLGPVVPVRDGDGREFALAFYDALFHGRSFGEAVRTAREFSVKVTGETNLLWAGMRFFGDPAAVPLPQPDRSESLTDGLSGNTLLDLIERRNHERQHDRSSGDNQSIRGSSPFGNHAIRGGTGTNHVRQSDPQPTQTSAARPSGTGVIELPRCCSECGREVHTHHGIGRKQQTAAGWRMICRRCVRHSQAESGKRSTEGRTVALVTQPSHVASGETPLPSNSKDSPAVGTVPPVNPVFPALEPTQARVLPASTREEQQVEELVELIRQRLPLEISLSASQFAAETSKPEALAVAAMSKAGERFRLHLDEVAPFGWVLSQ